MSLRDTLTKNFPTGTTEYGPEHSIKTLVVSEEGFKDFVKRRLSAFKSKKDQGTADANKTTQSSEEVQGNFKWAEENIIKGKPSKHVFKEGTVDLGVKHAAFFYRGNKKVDDLLKEVVSDLAVYQNLVNRYKTQAINNNKQVIKIKKEAEAFEARDKHPEGLDEFAKLMKKWESYVSPISPGFSEPNVEFLGYGKQSFTENGLFHIDDTQPKPIKVNDTKVNTLTPEEADKAAELVKKVIALGNVVDQITENEGCTGVDASDSPFRGYYKEVGNKDQSLLMLYTMPNFELLSTGLFYQLSERLGQLQDVLISYIRKSIQS
tara:strand:+ start:1595 stop:2554 length:960 start_codon:yes stop_codon:yes gene_type:complete